MATSFSSASTSLWRIEIDAVAVRSRHTSPRDGPYRLGVVLRSATYSSVWGRLGFGGDGHRRGLDEFVTTCDGVVFDPHG
jgi:hypothetical protein